MRYSLPGCVSCFWRGNWFSPEAILVNKLLELLRSLKMWFWKLLLLNRKEDMEMLYNELTKEVVTSYEAPTPTRTPDTTRTRTREYL